MAQIFPSRGAVARRNLLLDDVEASGSRTEARQRQPPLSWERVFGSYSMGLPSPLDDSRRQFIDRLDPDG